MPQRVRIADRFKTQSAEQLVTMAGAVITGLTNNPAFPAPTVDLKAVQAAADDLNAALAAQAHGGTAATAEKNNKQEARSIPDQRSSVAFACSQGDVGRNYSQNRGPKALG